MQVRVGRLALRSATGDLPLGQHNPAAERRQTIRPGEIGLDSSRLRIPDTGSTVVQDLIHGPVVFDHQQLDDWILVRTDGTPTYNFCVVVDDVEMRISHVIRGNDHLSNTPKQVLCYEALGYPVPAFAHVSMILGADRARLSKRHGATSVQAYREQGILPEALVNYLGLMAWSMPSGEEKFSLQEMVDNFDLSRVSLGGPIFDIEKLSWLNGQWLRDLPVEEFASRLQTWALNPEYMMKIAPHVQGRVETFSQVAPLAGFFFAGGVNPDVKLFESKKLSGDQVRQLMQLILWKLESLRQWEKDSITATIQAVVESLELKLRDAMPLMFASITGQASSVSVLDAMEILGPDLTRFRLRQAIDLLGGVSKKENKEWEKLLGSIA